MLSSPRRKKTHRSTSAMTANERTARSQARDVKTGSAVKVPKEIQVRRLKEAFKTADERGEGRVDLEGFRVALDVLQLECTDLSSRMLFAMSIPSEEAEELTYMDFYKTLKKGCENYPGCSAIDVVGNLVMEYSNTSEGRRARNRTATSTSMATYQRQLMAEEAERARREAAPEDPSKGDIAAQPGQNQDSLEIGYNGAKAKGGHDRESQSERGKPQRHRNETQSARAPSKKPRLSVSGNPQNFNERLHDHQQQYGGYHPPVIEEDRYSNRGDDRYSNHEFPVLPPGPRGHYLQSQPYPGPGGHGYSQSFSHLDLQQQLQSAGFHNPHAGYGMHAPPMNAYQSHPAPTPYDSITPANLGGAPRPSYSERSFERPATHNNEPSEPPSQPTHRKQSSRVTIDEEEEDSEEQMSLMDTYHSHLADVGNLLNKPEDYQEEPRRFSHHRGQSVSVQERVDLTPIINYLRSQDQILTARLVSLEDNLRRQVNAQQTLISKIPIYSKKQIISWMTKESDMLINAVSKNCQEIQQSFTDELKNHVEANSDQSEFDEKIKEMNRKLVTATTQVDKLSRESHNAYLETGSSLSILTEEVTSLGNLIGTGGGVSSGTEPTMNVLEAQFDNLEAVVEQNATDVHLKLGGRIENLESMLIAIAMNQGVQIPESANWNDEHAKLVNEKLGQIQQQKDALEQKSAELQKIKKEMEAQAKKLAGDRQELSIIRKENEKTKQDIAKIKQELQDERDKLKEREEQIEVSRIAAEEQAVAGLTVEQVAAMGGGQELQEIIKQKEELEKLSGQFESDKKEYTETQEKKLLQLEKKTLELQEIKSELKLEQKKIKSKREQLKKDEKHVEECKNDLETIFEEIANKRNEILNREQKCQRREDELRKVEKQVDSILQERKDLDMARQKMEDVREKIMIDLEEKDKEIQKWKTKATSNLQGSASAEELEQLQAAFEAQQQELINKHNEEKKKLAVAARTKFKKDFQKEIENAAVMAQNEKKVLEKQRKRLKEEEKRVEQMTKDLLKSMQVFEKSKTETMADIKKERDLLSLEKQRFHQLLQEVESNHLGNKDAGTNDSGIDDFLNDLGGGLFITEDAAFPE